MLLHSPRFLERNQFDIVNDIIWKMSHVMFVLNIYILFVCIFKLIDFNIDHKLHDFNYFKCTTADLLPKNKHNIFLST